MFPAAALQPPMINTFCWLFARRAIDFLKTHPAHLVITAIAFGIIGSAAALPFLTIAPEISAVLGFTFFTLSQESFAGTIIALIGGLLVSITGIYEEALIESASNHLKPSYHLLLLIISVALLALGVLTIVYLPGILITGLISQWILFTALSIAMSSGMSVFTLTGCGIGKLIW